jgi:hypothetical protein
MDFFYLALWAAAAIAAFVLWLRSYAMAGMRAIMVASPRVAAVTLPLEINQHKADFRSKDLL